MTLELKMSGSSMANKLILSVGFVHFCKADTLQKF